MELKNYFAQDDAGNILTAATCYLYERGTENLVEVLQGANGLALTNPFVSDQQGLVQFAAPNGLYDLRVVKGNRDHRLRMQCNDVTETTAAAENAARALEDKLKDPTDPSKGAGLSAFGRSKISIAVSTVGSFLSAQWYNMWEFSYKVTERPDVNEPATWDWAPAVQEGLVKSQGGVLYIPSHFKPWLGSSINVPKNSATHTTVIGDKGLSCFRLKPGVITAFRLPATTKGDWIKNITLKGFDVDASLSGNVDGAIIFGSRQNKVEPKGLNWDNITIEDCRSVGVIPDPTFVNSRVSIHMVSLFDALGETPTTITNITIRNISQDGGNTGAFIGAGVPGSNDAPCWMDNILIDGFWHSVGIQGNNFQGSTIQIGQDAYGNKVRVKNVTSFDSGDNVVEVNGCLDVEIEDCYGIRPGTSFHIANFHALENPDLQRTTFRRCHTIDTRGAPGFQVGPANPLGHFVYEDCTAESVEGFHGRFFRGGYTAPYHGPRSVKFRKCTVFIKGFNSPTAYRGGIVDIQSNQDFVVDIDGLDIKIVGESTSPDQTVYGLLLSSTESVSAHLTVKSMTYSDKRTGSVSESASIAVRGLVKVIGSVDNLTNDSTVGGARSGIVVYGVDTPKPDLKVANSDLSGCTSTREIWSTSTAQRNNIRFDNVKPNNPLDAVFGPAVLTLTGSPFWYKNQKGMPIRLLVNGGAGVVLDISQDGVTFYPVGVAAGVILLMPNETLRFTYSVAPSVRILTTTKLTA